MQDEQLSFPEDWFYPHYILPEEAIADLPVTLKCYGSRGNFYSTHSTKPHPGFALLRQTLESQGYISTAPWCNGDTVEKTFAVNYTVFNPGDRFFSPTALLWHIKRRDGYRGYSESK